VVCDKFRGRAAASYKSRLCGFVRFFSHAAICSQVGLQGPGFSYAAKPNFEGQDAFTIQVAGTMARMTGTSDIQVTVSVAK
jgi:hypothetical protein